ncbi:hypothetical protein BJ138DRAFT_1110460 [Hygrophoropsis aurantiaca]|uniref:Uncharacterized protein n=1 Tax=Hygrophoropsis aurantiaca TaxID=72124 RepID=A0ACB8AMC7_9AGAM|nr:hypothetical protein BJ138DRAFT_1110460 [Hygrophoropsis aurantiaca]
MSSSLLIEPSAPQGPPTLDTLPLDILYRIISFTSVLDIVRFQQISKHFRELMQTGTIWRNAYRTTSLPRYPGPFPHQSAAFLRDTLVRSAKVAQNWAPNVPVPTSQRTFEGDKDYSRPCFFMNRWLMVIDDKHSINCVDLDTASGVVTPPISYRSDEGRFIEDHWYLSTMSPEGHTLAFAIVLEMTHTHLGGQVLWVAPIFILNSNIHNGGRNSKLFKLISNNGTTPIFEFVQSYSTNWPWDGRGLGVRCFIGPRLLVIAGGDINRKTLYIDLETFRAYSVSLPPAEIKCSATFISCVKHLLVIRSPMPQMVDGHITLDVLAIPPPGTGFPSDALKLSHRGRHPGAFAHTYLLHDPVANPWLGEPHILLYAVAQMVPGTTFSIDRIKVILSDDNCSIRCETQTITKSDFNYYFPSIFSDNGMGGSSRSIHIHYTSPGPQLRAGVLTLQNNSDMYEGSQGIRNIPELRQYDRVVGVDRVTGRVVLYTMAPPGHRVIRVLEFA